MWWNKTVSLTIATDKFLEISHPYTLSLPNVPINNYFLYFPSGREGVGGNWISVIGIIFFYLNAQNNLEGSKKSFPNLSSHVTDLFCKELQSSSGCHGYLLLEITLMETKPLYCLRNSNIQKKSCKKSPQTGMFLHRWPGRSSHFWITCKLWWHCYRV